MGVHTTAVGGWVGMGATSPPHNQNETLCAIPSEARCSNDETALAAPRERSLLNALGFPLKPVGGNGRVLE